MKTIFALWFALCLSAGAALPGPAWLASTVKPAGGAPACVTLGDQSSAIYNVDLNIGYYNKAMATRFTCTNTSTACSIAMPMRSHGTFAGSVWCGIYSDNPSGFGFPDSQLGKTADIPWANIPTGANTWITNSLSSTVALNNGTVYWAVAFMDKNDGAGAYIDTYSADITGNRSVYGEIGNWGSISTNVYKDAFIIITQ